MAHKKGPEAIVLRALCEYLTRKKHFFWRSNNVGVFDVAKGFHRNLPFGSMKGIPDICLIDKTGHFIGIEAKAPKGKLSEDQKTFQQKCKETGCEYYIARSIDDLIAVGL